MRTNILILFLLSFFSVKGQTFVEGQVFDAGTKNPIAYANIYLKGTTLGTTTDDIGYFKIKLNTFHDSITAAFLGYDEQTKAIIKQPKQTINFYLSATQSMLAEAVIVARKGTLENYLIKQILAHKKENNRTHLQNYSYETYNKIELDVKNMSDKFMDRKILKPFKFVFDNIDSTSEEEPFLPLMLSESISDVYYTNKLNKKREVIKASKMSGVSDASFNEFLSETYQDINIYDNAYSILEKDFISPIANSCKTFYNYKVIDTLVLDNVVHYKMMFEPKTKGDNTFFGSFIVSENNYAIKSIQMRMAPHVNINFVRKLEIDQNFEFVNQQFWMLKDDFIKIEFAPIKNKPAIVTKKNAVYSNYKINSNYNDSVIATLKETTTYASENLTKDQAFWDTSRQIQLSKNEAAIYHIIDTIKTIKAYKTYVDILNMVLTGYYPVGPVELGPIVSLISNNKLEGWRFGLGIRTNEKLCKWMQAEGHIAYGLRDKRVKGDVGIRFLATKTPRQIFEASYKHDVSELSRTSDLLDADNILNLIINRRKPLPRLLYFESINVGYNIEYKQGYSVGLAFQNRRIEQGLVPFRYIYPTSESGMDTFKTLNQTEFILNARFAIGEKFINKNSLFRSSINTSTIPVINLEYVAGIKKILGSQFNYHKLIVSYQQIIPIRTIGRLEIKLQAGKVFGEVPFLLTEVHDGNQTFAFSNTAFNVMNDYEFYSDQYLQWNIAHHFDGFFLNRIPGIRKLQWREVIHTRGVWGSVSSRNKTMNELNNSFIHPLGKVPYIEVGFGIENILKFLRYDVMWRVTHRNEPRTYNWMMTFGFDFKF
ncbi:MAG: DUF5686 family protein [Chitinophagales bacterium]